jgi:DNA-binding transcriptional regulator YbjK
MRTTLTLDDDVAAMLERYRKASRLGLKDAVNEAMRRGLTQLAQAKPEPRPAYRTPSVALGRCLVEGIDDVSEVLAVAEGESYR